jgi:hypothetical protein
VPTEPTTATDPWTAFLDWLTTIIIPDWNGLINLLPILLIVGLIGPVLTLLAAYWFFVRLKTRRGRVRTGEPEPVMAQTDAMGNPIFPPNTPYCPTHALLYPPTAKRCEIDGTELQVRCPVDDNVRVAGQEICRVCGTRYQLGASVAPVVVRRQGRPPEGGAAIA